MADLIDRTALRYAMTHSGLYLAPHQSEKLLALIDAAPEAGAPQGEKFGESPTPAEPVEPSAGLIDREKLRAAVQKVADDYGADDAVLAILNRIDSADPVEPSAALREALRQTLNALAFTYSNVPDLARPHWCHFDNGNHEPTCAALLHIQDEARAALHPETETKP